MKITGIAWLAGGSSGFAGIARVISDRNEVQYFCKVFTFRENSSETDDITSIALMGNSLDPIVGEQLILRAGRPTNIDIIGP